MGTTKEVQECRSEDGVSIGLIDTILNAAVLLSQRNLWGAPRAEDNPAIEGALDDLLASRELRGLLGLAIYRSKPSMDQLEERVKLGRIVNRTAEQEKRLRELDRFSQALPFTNSVQCKDLREEVEALFPDQMHDIQRRQCEKVGHFCMNCMEVVAKQIDELDAKAQNADATLEAYVAFAADIADAVRVASGYTGLKTICGDVSLDTFKYVASVEQLKTLSEYIAEKFVDLAAVRFKDKIADPAKCVRCNTRPRRLPTEFLCLPCQDLKNELLSKFMAGS